MHPWRRYVAIGDSFTEGLCDPAPPGDQNPAGAYLGWADRLATRLAIDVGDDARDEARDDGPGVGGGNDILRPRADVDALAQSLDDAVARIRATGADALLVTPVDPKDAPVIRSTRGRVATFVAHQNVIARRHGPFLVDQWSPAVPRDWRLWAEDRIHLTPDGHRRVVAAAALTLGLAVEDGWSIQLPPRAAPDRRQTLRQDARRARHHLGPWVRRRLRGQSSGDAVVAKRPALQPVSGDGPA
jgi:lysophospholipase L1-like esterase